MKITVNYKQFNIEIVEVATDKPASIYFHTSAIKDIIKCIIDCAVKLDNKGY